MINAIQSAGSSLVDFGGNAARKAGRTLTHLKKNYLDPVVLPTIQAVGKELMTFSQAAATTMRNTFDNFQNLYFEHFSNPMICFLPGVLGSFTTFVYSIVTLPRPTEGMTFREGASSFISHIFETFDNKISLISSFLLLVGLSQAILYSWDKRHDSKDQEIFSPFETKYKAKALGRLVEEYTAAGANQPNEEFTFNHLKTEIEQLLVESEQLIHKLQGRLFKKFLSVRREILQFNLIELKARREFWELQRNENRGVDPVPVAFHIQLEPRNVQETKPVKSREPRKLKQKVIQEQRNHPSYNQLQHRYPTGRKR